MLIDSPIRLITLNVLFLIRFLMAVIKMLFIMALALLGLAGLWQCTPWTLYHAGCNSGTKGKLNTHHAQNRI